MDSDSENEEYQQWKGVPATIVLINMYNPSKSASPTVSHEAACRMIRRHLREASTHYVGVCLYGTEVDTSSFGLQNVHEICPLALPNLDDFKKLQGIKIDAYKQAKELILSEALWHCGKMFTNCKKQLVSRTILILTILSVAPVESDQRPTNVRVSNLVESNIEIKLLNVSEENANIDKFYSKFLTEANGGLEVAIPKPVWDVKEIENMMYQQSHRHLAITKLSFELGNEVAIGVGVYGLLKSTNQLKKTDLNRDTNEVLTSVTKKTKVTIGDTNSEAMSIDEDDNEQKELPLLKSELLHYQEYGGQRIEFTDKEKKQMSNPFGPPMLKLLGFKPASILKMEKWFLKQGYFLFPNEDVIEGSTIAFKALHTACLETSVVAICVLCTRVNSRPFIVALAPCTKPLGLEVEIGFDVITIPFIESVRDITVEEDDNTDVTEEHRKAMRDLIKDLVFDYKPEMFENPKTQTLYRAIEAIALTDEDVDPFVDTTKPASERFQGIQEDIFDQLFGPFGVDTVKRPAPSKAGGGGKKLKSDNNIEIDEDLLQKHIRDGKVASYTVPQLKQILQSKNIPNLPAMTGLRKNDLVDLVYKYC